MTELARIALGETVRVRRGFVEQTGGLREGAIPTVVGSTPCCGVTYHLAKEYFTRFGHTVQGCGKNTGGRRGSRPGNPGCGYPWWIELVPESDTDDEPVLRWHLRPPQAAK